LHRQGSNTGFEIVRVVLDAEHFLEEEEILDFVGPLLTVVVNNVFQLEVSGSEGEDEV
jgi:hypothetical protein